MWLSSAMESTLSSGLVCSRALSSSLRALPPPSSCAQDSEPRPYSTSPWCQESNFHSQIHTALSQSLPWNPQAPAGVHFLPSASAQLKPEAFSTTQIVLPGGLKTWPHLQGLCDSQWVTESTGSPARSLCTLPTHLTMLGWRARLSPNCFTGVSQLPRKRPWQRDTFS